MGKKRRKRILAAVLLVLVLLAGVTGIYIGDYYHASAEAVSSLEEVQEEYKIYKDGKNIVFEPENAQAGLIFYPGGKVACEAYAPLMEKLADAGVLCVLVKMPGNLAVLDISAADGIRQQFPQITRWYIGGHSLGGAMAASYLGKHAAEYEGLLLLGAYSAEDLSDTDLKVLALYGSEDGVLNREKFDSCRKNLPENTTIMEIDGGCHSYFGDYGMQKGDGVPTISRGEQMAEVTEAFLQVQSQ